MRKQRRQEDSQQWQGSPLGQTSLALMHHLPPFSCTSTMMSNTYSNPPATHFLIHAHYYTVNLGHLSPPPAYPWRRPDNFLHVLLVCRYCHPYLKACNWPCMQPWSQGHSTKKKLFKAQKPTSGWASRNSRSLTWRHKIWQATKTMKKGKMHQTWNLTTCQKKKEKKKKER